MGEVTWLGPVELDLETLRSFITVSEEESLARAAQIERSTHQQEADSTPPHARAYKKRHLLNAYD